MKTTTFTCTKSAEELEKSARQRSMLYGLMMWLCPLMPVLIVYILSSVCQEEELAIIPILLFTVTVVMAVYCFIIFYKTKKRLPSKYELMPTKEFSWDETTKQFTYKDKDCTLRFKGDDIEKWVSYVNNKSNEPTEIVTLRTGEKFILEGEWNMEVHDFLNLNRTELALPKPKRWTWSYEVY